MLEMLFKLKMFICTVVILLNATACSNLKIIYHQLDWFIPAYIDQFISLEDKQYRYVEAKIEDLLKWHCEKELVTYSELLDTFSVDLNNDNLNSKQVIYYREQLDILWTNIVKQASPALVEFFDSTSDDQIQQLSKSIKQQNEEIREKYIDAKYDEVHELLVKRMEDRVERWVDELEDSQKLIILEWSKNAVGGQSQWFENRVNWQNVFFSTIKQYRNNEQKMNTEFIKLFLHPEDYWTVEYKHNVKQYRENLMNLLVRLARSITSQQKAFMLKKLKNYSADFRELSCKA